MKALAFSGGKDSMACLHLMRGELACAIYIDTGYAYPETRALVEYVSTMLPVHVVKVGRSDAIPSEIVPADWTEFGQLCTTKKAVTIRNYHDCCLEHVALPLVAKAKELGVTELVYGQRNDESHKATSRDGDMVQGIIRRHPIEDWSAADVLKYLALKMEIPAHYAIKHSSLDCYDCTAYRAESKDRIEFTRKHHPVFFKAYGKRMDALNSAIKEALNA